MVEALLGGAVDRLTRVFAWSAVLLNWSRPQLQHDVGAFASHALAKLRIKTGMQWKGWLMLKLIKHEKNRNPK